MAHHENHNEEGSPLIQNSSSEIEEDEKNICPSSPEFLSPAHHSELRNASSMSFVSSLVSTMLGGGILSLPYTTACCGVILTIILLFLMGAVNDFSLYVLIGASRRSGGSTYELIAQRAFGKKAQFLVICLLLILLCLCCVGYLVLISDLVFPLLQFVVEKSNGKWLQELGDVWGVRLTIVFGIVVTFPLCCMKSLDRLSYTSLLSAVSILCLAAALAYRGFSCYFGDVHSNKWCYKYDGVIQEIGDIPLWPDDPQNVLIALPIITVSYLCHFNVLGMHSAYRNPSRQRVGGVVHATIFSSAALYSLVGVTGFLYAQKNVCGNVLKNFATNDPLIVAGRFGLALTVLLSFPLLVVPCRQTCNKFYDFIMVEWISPRKDEDDIDEDDLYENGTRNGQNRSRNGSRILFGYGSVDSDDEEESLRKHNHYAYDDENNDSLASPLIWDGETSTMPVGAGAPDEKFDPPLNHERPRLMRWIQTFFISVISMVCAWYIPGVVTVWSIMGSSVSIVIAYILPCVFYLKVRSRKQFNWRKLCCYIIIIISIVLIPMCTYEAVKQAINAGDQALTGRSCVEKLKPSHHNNSYSTARNITEFLYN